MLDNLIKFLSNLQSYFNDFIGLIAPSLIFYSLLSPALNIDAKDIASHAKLFGELAWLPVLAGLFATGHVLGSLAAAAEKLALRVVNIGTYFRKTPRPHSDTFTMTPDVVVFRCLVAKALEVNLGNLDRSQLRSVAMTMSGDGEELGRRFRFTATFCGATTAAIALLALANFYSLLAGAANTSARIGYLFLAVAIIYVLRIPKASYTARAEAVPFGTAIGDICLAKLQMKTPVTGGTVGTAAPTPVSSEAELAALRGKTPQAPNVFPL